LSDALDGALISRVSDWPKTFKEAFCEKYRCSQDQYIRRAFRACLYRRAVLFAPVIKALSPNFFQVDMDAIERVGSQQFSFWRLFVRETG